jgi:L-alanine-DL-glutamate epimerase-like enolase superfamily enzyme
MIIERIDAITLRIPFTDGSSGAGLFPGRWDHLDLVLVRIATREGLVGWGEGFGYFCAPAVASMVASAYAPLLLGRELPTSIAALRALNLELQKRSVLPGRHGITTFALSGVDLALWDLLGKAQGASIAKLLGGRQRGTLPAYASLVRYGTAELVVHHARRACADGYREIKLHEITLPEIRAARAAIGDGIAMTVDVNCNWSAEFVREVAPELARLGVRWLEEPVFPPEDHAALAVLRGLGVALAAGENLCTALPFAEQTRQSAVDFTQPSVTKVGGLSQLLAVAEATAAVPLAPHCPYFGPGFLATLQFAAAEPRVDTIEWLYIDPAAWIYRDMPVPRQGQITVPSGPGLGLDPDPAALATYTTATTTRSL